MTPSASPSRSPVANLSRANLRGVVAREVEPDVLMPGSGGTTGQPAPLKRDGLLLVLVDQAGQVVPRSFQTNQSPLPLSAPGWYGWL